MFYVPQLPCYKIFKESANSLIIIWYDAQQNTGHFRQDCAGSFMIRFLEMDLTEYVNAINVLCNSGQFKTQLLFEQGYRKTKEQLLDTADLLADNLHLHRLLVGAMEMIFEDEALSDVEQLEKANLELLYIVQMYNQFAQALLFCLEADSYTEIGIARKFAGFIQSTKRFRSYRFQTGYGIAPVDKHGNLDYDTVQKLNSEDVDLETQLDTVQNGQGGVSLLPFTWILSFEDLIFFDFPPPAADVSQYTPLVSVPKV